MERGEGKVSSYVKLLEKKCNNITHIFDNDDKEENRYIGGIDICIEKPNKEKIK